jgi:uncharacterized protein (DUF1778 family)
MQSKSKKSNQRSRPKAHLSVYPTDAQIELVRRVAEKQHRSVANYILSVLIPQAEKDSK